MAYFNEDDELDVENMPEDKVDPFALPLDLEAGQQNEDEQIDQEVNSNEQFQKALSQAVKGISPKTEQAENDLVKEFDALPEEKAPSRLDQYKNYLSEYSKLQSNRRNADLVNGLLSAGGKIGQSMAGKYSGNFNPDQSGMKMLEQMANRPVTDFEQGQAVQDKGIKLKQSLDSDDPASPQSKLIRDYINKKLGMQLGDDVSAHDAEKLLKTIGRPSQQKAGQIVRTFNPQTGQVEVQVFDPSSMSLKPLGQTAGFALQPRTDPRTGEVMVVNPATGQKQSNLTAPSALETSAAKEKAPDITRENLTTKQQALLDKARENFLQDTKDDRTALNAAQGIQMTLASGDEIGGDILREIQNQLARGSGEKGAMTDRDVAPFGGRQDVMSRVQRAIEMSADGKLPTEDRQFLTQIAKVMENRAKTYVSNKSDFFVNNMQQDLQSSPHLKDSKVNKQSVQKLIGVDAAVSPQDPNKKKMLKEKKSGRLVPIKADRYDEALKSGLFEKSEE